MTDIRDALKDELDALEQELQDDPRFLKIKHLQQLLALYDGTAPKTPRPARARRKGSAGREAALRHAADFIRDSDGPMRTADILAYLELHNVIIDGQAPVSNLSAMLSRSEDFISHGRAGWTLAPGVIRSDIPDGMRDRALPPSDATDPLDDLLGDTE